MVKTNDSERGRDAAQRLWQQGLSDVVIDDPLNNEFAEAALKELEDLQRETPGVLRDVLHGAQISAEQLNVEPFHGVVEVIQNADDLGASEVRIAVREARDRTSLLIVHNGARVRLEHVLAMTLAFVSTKRDDPRAKGRFGIGLKTLGRLGDSLTVNCPPYGFTIEGNSVRSNPLRRAIAGFYDPRSTDTLFAVRLDARWDAKDVKSWFASLGASSMVFLDSVRSLRLVDTRRKKTIAHHRLTRTRRRRIDLPGMAESCDVVELREPRTQHAWVKYSFDRKVPSDIKRRHKAIGETTPIGIAVPAKAEDGGLIYAGLPTSIQTELPICINAQFDVDTARRGLQHERLNSWLLDRVAELTASVALSRLETEPDSAWNVIPLGNESEVDGDPWIAERVAELVESVQRRVRRRLRILIDDKCHKLSELTSEVEALTAVLDKQDVRLLRPEHVMLPAQGRDKAGRWREVLDDLGGADLVQVADALNLLDLDDDIVEPRGVDWLIRLARAGIESGLGETLWNKRCVLTNDGNRIVPPLPHYEGELLIRKLPPDSLATRLKLAHVIHPRYLSRQHDVTVVREWLEQKGMLRDAPDAHGLLQAIATRGAKHEPIQVDDECLCLIRNALGKVASSKRKEIGRELGRAITIDVQCWKDGKRVSVKARPTGTYLPARIEDRKEGWSKAAGQTPGLHWVHPRYSRVLRQPSGGTSKKQLGARAFFQLLGAEDAPRMMEPGRKDTRFEDPASPIDFGRLPASQRESLAQLGNRATHLKREKLCPDLVLVLQDIQEESSIPKRRARCSSLLRTLDREWERRYSTRLEAQAVYSDRKWRPVGVVPTRWIAQLRDEPWLTNEAGDSCRPSELVVRTPATEAIFGDARDLFASEIDAALARSPVVRALGVRADPQVSEMIDELKDMRQDGRDADTDRIKLLYAAIAAACKRRESKPSDRVGDLTVRELRSRFGTRRAKQGLVYASGHWLPPSSVFLGAPVFGVRRAFVSERPATALWRTVRVSQPDLGDCIDVLLELASEPTAVESQDILVNTYQYMEPLLDEAPAKQVVRLAELPLWTGAEWVTRRPVYLVYESGIGQALSASRPVWDIPISTKAVPGLIQAVGATVLDEACFDPQFHSQALLEGEPYLNRFQTAIKLLEDWLARHDRKLSESRSISWQELLSARLAIEPTLKLECRIGRRSPITVHARVHVTRDPLTFYFADPEAIGEDDAGGLLLSRFFTDGDMEKLALAWSRCWHRSSEGVAGLVRLAEDDGDDTSLSELFKQATKPSSPRRRSSDSALAKGKKGAPATKPEEIPERRLKTPDDLTGTEVSLVGFDEERPKKPQRRRGLRDDIPKGRPIGRGNRAPRTAPRAYSEQDKEELALLVLQHAINGDLADLRDFHHLRGVGADALDTLRRFFELKASYGAMPDEVSLTANEVERAIREGKNYFLAVVAGLEEGYDTVVRIIANPLANLTVKDSTSVTLAGLHSVKSALEVRFEKATE